MTATVVAACTLTALEHRVQLRRAVIASTIGTTIEWYDFFLYSTVTGLVFAKLYFPESDPLVGTLQAFGIYAVGFVARPVGAALFGHYGDPETLNKADGGEDNGAPDANRIVAGDEADGEGRQARRQQRR